MNSGDLVEADACDRFAMILSSMSVMFITCVTWSRTQRAPEVFPDVGAEVLMWAKS
jgi:hypothetical protein